MRVYVSHKPSKPIQPNLKNPRSQRWVEHSFEPWIPLRPTVCLGATYVMVYTYGCDSGNNGQTRCAVIVAVLGDRCTPLPACSTPPAGAGSARSALVAGSTLASIADLGVSRRLRTIEPSGTMPYGDASRATCAPGIRPCPLHPCRV